MPIYMETSRLYRTVTIVARGTVTAEEVRNTVQQLFDAHLPEYTKIVDVSAARSDLSEEQIQRLADLLRGDADDTRGAVAFIINPDRVGFAHSFANITRGDRPISLFKSLHEARDWLARSGLARAELMAAPADKSGEKPSPWNDPNREGMVLRGRRARAVAIA
jgi:hypothetical protein